MQIIEAEGSLVPSILRRSAVCCRCCSACFCASRRSSNAHSLAAALFICKKEKPDCCYGPAPNGFRTLVRVTQSILTPRERRVLALAACGCGSKEIATRLRVSTTTVKFHFANVFRTIVSGHAGARGQHRPRGTLARACTPHPSRRGQRAGCLLTQANYAEAACERCRGMISRSNGTSSQCG